MAFQPGQSGNPAGRPKGSVNKNLALLREAVEKVLPLVVNRALDGDVDAQKLILERGLPKLKPVEAPVEFILPEHENCSPVSYVLAQVAEGNLPLSSMKEIVKILALCPTEKKYIGNQIQHTGNAYLHSLLDTTD